VHCRSTVKATVYQDCSTSDCTNDRSTLEAAVEARRVEGQKGVDFGPMLRSKAAIRFAVSTMNCDWPQWPKSRWLLRRLNRRFGTMRWSAYSHACSVGAYGPAQRAT